jgi:hypothetical protein
MRDIGGPEAIDAILLALKVMRPDDHRLAVYWHNLSIVAPFGAA